MIEEQTVEIKVRVLDMSARQLKQLRVVYGLPFAQHQQVELYCWFDGTVLGKNHREAPHVLAELDGEVFLICPEYLPRNLTEAELYGKVIPQALVK